MHEQTPDGMDQELRAAMRTALTVAGRVAEVIARHREQLLREQQTATQQRARELQQRVEGERLAARAAVAPVERAEWWQAAEPQEIAAMWETAAAWREVDADVARAADRIGDEVRTRYDIDVHAPGPVDAAVGEAVARREAEIEAAAAGARRDSDDAQLHAAALLRGEDTERGDDQAPAQAMDRAGVDSHLGYDSVERRRQLALRLEGVADAPTVQARVLADTYQARPAQDAVASTPGRAPTGRRARPGSGRVQERQRGR